LAHNLAYFATLAAIVAGVVAIFWFARHPGPKWARAPLGIGIVLFVGVFALLSFKLSWTGYDFFDFQTVYYQAGVAALHGDAATLSALTGNGVRGFVNIPIVAYLFAPLGSLSSSPATAVFTIVGVGLTVAAWALLARLAELETRERWLLAWLFVANGPLMNGVKFGNTSYEVVFALVAGLALIRSGRSGWAGVLLALTAIMKPPLLLFGVFFLLRRDVRGVVGLSVTGALIGLASLAVFGWADNWHWFQACILQFSHDWVAAFNLQSIDAFAARLGASPGILGRWDAEAPTTAERLLAECLTALVFLAAGLACLKRRAGPGATPDAEATRRLNLQYTLVICLALVASPLTWAHYYAWLLVPVAFFLGSQQTLPAIARWLGWTATALVTLPIAWPATFSSPVLARLYSSIIVSHLLFGGLLWLGLTAWWLARTGGYLSVSGNRAGGQAAAALASA